MASGPETAWTSSDSKISIFSSLPKDGTGVVYVIQILRMRKRTHFCGDGRRCKRARDCIGLFLKEKYFPSPPPDGRGDVNLWPL
jgi:hypothetical protein